jgi:hypothetical protein
VFFYRFECLDKSAPSSHFDGLAAQFLQRKAGKGRQLHKAGKDRKALKGLDGNNFIFMGVVDQNKQFAKGKKTPTLAYSQNSPAQPFSDHLLEQPHLKEISQKILQRDK